MESEMNTLGKKIRLWCVGLLLSSSFLAVTAYSQMPPGGIPHPQGYVALRAEHPPVIDGNLDDEAWQRAQWTRDFQDIEGTLKPTPRFRTRAKMTWDDRYLYIGAEIQEPHVWATLTKRDTVIFFDNDFEIFVDPNGDNREYYEFEMNALNTVWDLLLPWPYRDLGNPLDAWDIRGLKTGVAIHGTLNNFADHDTSWTVEIAMPWMSLGEFAHQPIPPNDGDQWRINFSRVEWKVDDHGRKLPATPEDNWVWSPQWVVDMHQPEMWGYVQLSTKTEGHVAFRPDPSWPCRLALYSVYKAEKKYFERHGVYADSVEALDVDVSTWTCIPMIRLNGYGYTAGIQFGNSGIHMDQSSRIW